MAERSPMDIARERIAQEERQDSTVLDLSRLGLEALPPELGRLTNLTTLYLDHNLLTALPPELGRLTNLRELYLDRNRLTALPPELGKLEKLESLTLSENPLPEPLLAAYSRGIEELRTYLRSPREGEPL